MESAPGMSVKPAKHTLHLLSTDLDPPPFIPNSAL